jgi:hypothetical protein
MSPVDAGKRLKRYGEAWERADPAAAARLVSENRRPFETPFRPPPTGRDGMLRYWSAVPDGKADVSVRSRLFAMQSRTVIAHWSDFHSPHERGRRHFRWSVRARVR